MQEKTENNTFTNKYILVRSDNNKQISSIKFNDYQVAPAHHMNLSKHSFELYKNSGYLSTFMLTGGFGLEQALGLNHKYVHFIYIDKNVCEHFFLTGGTQGLTKEGKETTVDRFEGTSWEKPAFNHLIPQLFFTHTMQIELGLTGRRNLSEILLGGNWQDFVEIYSIERNVATEILKQASDEKNFYDLLKTKTNSYSVMQGVFCYDDAKGKLEKAQHLQQVFTWWNQFQNKTVFCFAYGMFYRGHPYELAEIAAREILDMHRLHQRLETVFASNPVVLTFFDLSVDTSMQLLKASAFDKLYQHLSTTFMAELKQVLTLPAIIRDQQAQQKMQIGQIVQKKLNIEIRFWRLYQEITKMRAGEAASYFFQKGREKIIQGWHISMHPLYQDEIIKSLTTINEEMDAFITAQAFNKSLQLQSNPESTKNLLGEWFKKFAAKYTRENIHNNATSLFIPPALKGLSGAITNFNKLSQDFFKRTPSDMQQEAYHKLQDKLHCVITKAINHQDLKKTHLFMQESVKQFSLCLATILAGQIRPMLLINLSDKLGQIEAKYLIREPEPVNMEISNQPG